MISGAGVQPALPGVVNKQQHAPEAKSQDQTTYCPKVTINVSSVALNSRDVKVKPSKGAVQVSLKSITNKEAQEYCWATTQYRFCHIISDDDFYRLTGENEGQAIITINGREYAVTPHKNLKAGEIIICPAFRSGLQESLAFQASGCQKRAKEHKDVVVKVRFPGDQPDSLTETEAIRKGVQSAMSGLPVSDDRVYQLQFAQDDKKSGVPIWYEYSFTVSLPHINTKEERHWDDDRKAMDVLTDKADDLKVHIELENKNIKVDKSKQTLKPPDYLMNPISTRNGILMNNWQFRQLQPQLQSGDEALVLVKKGAFYYYAYPLDKSEDSSPNIEVSTVFQETKDGSVIPVHERLKPAAQCDISLSWHRCHIKAHGLDQEAVEEQIRKTLRYVPMQEGKKFLVVLKDPEGRRLPAQLEGLVTRVTGETGGVPGVYQCAADTRLTLTPGEPAILDGTRPKGRTEEEIIARLSKGLYGVEDMAREIAQRVILPFGQDNAEKGILLYGPPGTGKSVLSRNIGAALYALDSRVVFINAGELMKTDPAASAKELREKVKKLYALKKEPAVLILDEIDTMLQSKDTFKESPTQQALRSELQSLMDSGGKEQHKNLVIVGTTNIPPEGFDKALMRTNRFSVHVRMGLPDQAQRRKMMASLFASQDSPKITISSELLDFLSRVTEKKNGADITQQVFEIIAVLKKGGDWNEESGLSVTREQIDSVLFPPDRCRMSHKQTMDSLQPDLSSSVLTKREKEAVEACMGTLTKVTGNLGLNAVIQVDAHPGARTPLFCAELLNQLKTHKVDYYATVPQTGRMISDAKIALYKAAGKICSIVVIDRADKLIGQTTEFANPAQVGGQWDQLKQSNNTSAALVFTTEGRQINGIDVTRVMQLPHPRKTVTLSAMASQDDMKAIVAEKYPGVPEEEVQAVLKVFNADVPVAVFEDLLNFHRIEKDGVVCGWSIPDLRHEYLEQQPQPNPMHS